ncbi:MAG: bifunctional UDP-N-acetylglucosamine diphosphorylase/glucosamine-1-phosphate N-acetyltransferase GlmU [Pseudomonadota bacterium]
MHQSSLAVILAAGKGTRMRSKTPKVLHPVGGLPMVHHVLAAAKAAGVGSTALVVAPDATWPQALPEPPATFVQDPPQGTAHALLCAKPAFAEGPDVVLVLYADTPLMRPATIARMVARVRDGADVAVLAFRPADPAGYGRLLMEGDRLTAIREHRDATDAERAIPLCNSGILAIRAGAPLEALGAIGNDNAKGEYYLTDLIEIGHAKGFAMVVEEAGEDEVMGVDDRAKLAKAEAVFQARARAAALACVTLEAPDTVHFSHDTVLEADVVVEPNVVFGPGVHVGAGARIRAFSHLEGARVAPGAIVGPYARLRPGADVGADARIGNFVEIKNATIADGAKVNHLSYVGDASVGAGANLGAGTITCNYDGVVKATTTIGEGAFIGSNSALVAPVTIGPRAYVGSGSVITEDVPGEALAIARGRQATKPDRSPARRKPS